MQARIQHVSIPVSPENLTATRTFYGQVMQLEEIPVPHALSALDVVWYRLGDTELHLLTEDLAASRSGRHFCIAVDEVETLRTRLEEAGVAVVGTTPVPGRPRYFCRDPSGNLIEITTIQGDYEELEQD